jgi:ABC-type glutathione transport system ATPase component
MYIRECYGPAGTRRTKKNDNDIPEMMGILAGPQFSLQMRVCGSQPVAGVSPRRVCPDPEFLSFFLVANPDSPNRLRGELFPLAETEKMNVHPLTARRELIGTSPITEREPGLAAIAFEGVAKVYPGRKGVAEVTALEGIDLAIREGSIQGIIGRSGAGKSTLIRLVNGLEAPSAGRVAVNGTVISQLCGQRLRRRAGRSA